MFWKSIKTKARKEHRCIFCEKIIAPGETYWREIGTFQDDFNDYCLCDMCKDIVTELYTGEELGDIDDIFGEYVWCKNPECNSSSLDWERIGETTRYKCYCDNCGNEFEVDFHEEFKKHLEGKTND